ncbi:hypothetical protein [Dictyobacter kobayashii]|nr:hypothetical protein [Dictyobacter kobayashii]GCE24514.1 hypothetical protein KDK_83140 [Dictyobacter kobayashii]
MFIGSGQKQTELFYELARLKQTIDQLNKTIRHSWKIFLWLVASIFISLLAANVVAIIANALNASSIGTIVMNLLGFLYLAIFIAIIISISSLTSKYFYRHELKKQYNYAISVHAYIPLFDHSQPIQLSWWNLMNAGFQLVRPIEQYRDPKWHLAGRPWRILVRGDVRIPVFRRRPNRNDKGNRLFKQHFVRMAAYCHLLEKCEHGKSPFGLVLEKGTYSCVTVPYNPSSKKAFHDSLIQARKTICNIGVLFPPPARNWQACIFCPHSRRERYTMASTCGNRFNWIPPNYRDQQSYY